LTTVRSGWVTSLALEVTVSAAPAAARRVVAGRPLVALPVPLPRLLVARPAPVLVRSATDGPLRR
jgi:hypothetical protein